MNKHGQLYLLAALIIAFILFMLASPTNIVKKTIIESRFESLSKNFDRESTRFLNTIIKDDNDVATTFLNFTIIFTSYSKTRNQDFGLLYGFIHDNTLYLGNYLPEDASFTFENKQYDLFGCFSNINTTFSIAGLDINIQDINLATFQSCQAAATVRGSPPYHLGITLNDPEHQLSFTVELPEGHPELVIIAEEQHGETKRVYSKGKFL